MKKLSGTIAVCALMVAVLAGGAQAATYSNPTSITIPDSGPANPYPSTIQVGGVPGAVGDVNVTVTSLSHSCTSDIDLLLVGPAGRSSLLLSHAGRGACTSTPGVPVTFTLDDEAASPYPCAEVSGSFKPVDDACFEDPEPFVPPAPAGPYPASLAAQDGGASSGAWSLFVLDQYAGDVGTISGGWSLDLLPAVNCAGRPATVSGHVGTAGNDVISGTPAADVLLGLGGKDTISGLGGKDVICGGAGKDTIRGGPGKDLLRGEGGRDKLKGQGGNDTCIGGAKPDTAKACEKQKSI